jgi:hypothetical protein
MTTITLLPVVKPRIVYKPHVFLAVLQVLDVLTTGWILHNFSSAAEGNPIVAAIFISTGLAVGLCLLLALKLGAVWLLWVCQTGVKIASTIYGAVILNNLLFLLLWATS